MRGMSQENRGLKKMWELSRPAEQKSASLTVFGGYLAANWLGTDIAHSLTTHDSDAVCAVWIEEKGREHENTQNDDIGHCGGDACSWVRTDFGGSRGPIRSSLMRRPLSKRKCVACHGAAAEKKFDATHSRMRTLCRLCLTVKNQRSLLTCRLMERKALLKSRLKHLSRT